MIVNKNTELGFIAKVSYNSLINYNNQRVRITDTVFILEYLYGKKWDYRDSRLWNDARFSSYLIDIQIKFNNGKDIDLSVLSDDIIKEYDFTRKERDILISGNLEERLWSILKFISDSEHQEYEIIFPEEIN